MPRLLGGGKVRLYSYRIGNLSRPLADRPYYIGGLRPIVQYQRIGLCYSYRYIRPVEPLRTSRHIAYYTAGRPYSRVSLQGIRYNYLLSRANRPRLAIQPLYGSSSRRLLRIRFTDPRYIAYTIRAVGRCAKAAAQAEQLLYSYRRY